MATKEQMASASEVHVKGMFRLQMVNKRTRKIEGDSGWSQNQVTTKGFNDMLAGCIVGQANSAQASSAVLATYSDAIVASRISIPGTCVPAVAVTASTLASTAQVTCSFDGANLTTNTVTIGAIGLHSTSDVTQALLAGQTYTTSQFTTDQDVNATYQIQFS